jgi:hypothetical protein
MNLTHDFDIDPFAMSFCGVGCGISLRILTIFSIQIETKISKSNSALSKTSHSSSDLVEMFGNFL